MKIEDKIKELNKEYNKYSQAIVKLLNDSLKDGEVFVFRKLKDGGYGVVLSEERNKLINTSEPTKNELLLNAINKALETKDDSWFIGKIEKYASKN